MAKVNGSALLTMKLNEDKRLQVGLQLYFYA